MSKFLVIVLILSCSGCVTLDKVKLKPIFKPSFGLSSFDNEKVRTGTDSRLMMVGKLLTPDETEDDLVEYVKKRLGIKVGIDISFRIQDRR